QRAHVVLARGGLILVDVELHDLELAGLLVGQGLEMRGHRLAGPAPGRPKVDEDGGRGRKDVVAELGVAGVGEFVGHRCSLRSCGSWTPYAGAEELLLATALW